MKENQSSLRSISSFIGVMYLHPEDGLKNPPNHVPGHKNSKGFLLYSSSPSVYSETEAPEAVIKPDL